MLSERVCIFNCLFVMTFCLSFSLHHSFCLAIVSLVMMRLSLLVIYSTVLNARALFFSRIRWWVLRIPSCKHASSKSKQKSIVQCVCVIPRGLFSFLPKRTKKIILLVFAIVYSRYLKWPLAAHPGHSPLACVMLELVLYCNHSFSLYCT